MPPAGFEPATPKTGQPQTHALDRADDTIARDGGHKSNYTGLHVVHPSDNLWSNQRKLEAHRSLQILSFFMGLPNT